MYAENGCKLYNRKLVYSDLITSDDDDSTVWSSWLETGMTTTKLDSHLLTVWKHSTTKKNGMFMRKNCKPQCMVYHDKRTKYSKLIFFKKCLSLSYPQPKQSSVIAVVTTNHLFIRFTEEEEKTWWWGKDDDESPWENWKIYRLLLSILLCNHHCCIDP